MKAQANCRDCKWEKTVERPEGGQTLFGTLGWYMARHDSRHDIGLVFD